REDRLFGLEHGVDYVALSFVRRAEDVQELQKVIAQTVSRTVPVVAKIERQEAVERFDEILAVSDAVMVARGDLGVELPPEEVPLIQKHIVRRCNDAGVPVIIATQMLESMIEQPRPTRAEANDVANAVLDGADAVMLSGETSVGRFPVEAVQVMDQIIRRSEAEPRTWKAPKATPLSTEKKVFDAIARAACVLAEEVGARAIIVMTHTGGTALAMSKYRPTSRIVAVTDQDSVLRKLNLVWGIRGMVIPDFVKDSDSAFKRVQDELKQLNYVESGDMVVFTAGLPFWTRGVTNSLKVERVE
ncbi:MAG: pyruvate kinase, partial [Bacteroidota bacterium]